MKRILSPAAFGLLFALTVGLVGQPAFADSRDEARQHFAAGQAKYKSGDLHGAVVEYMAADALVPAPILSFDMALCYDQLGEAALAVRMYDDYLRRRPTAPNRVQVEARIEVLQGQSGAATPQPPAMPPPREEGAPPPPPGASGSGDELHAPAGSPDAPRQRPYDQPFANRVPSRGEAEQAPRGEAEQAPPEQLAVQPMQPPAPTSEETPVYKEWWFWVAIGVGAIVVVDIATTNGNHNTSSQATARPVAPAPGGLVFHF